MNSSKIEKKDKLREYYDSYEYMPKNLKNTFDGDVSILILKQEYIGKGIGTMIFNKICQMAKLDGIKTLAIDTDDSCNVGFYEKNNCKKMYETNIYNGEKIIEKAYVFAKEL